MPQDIKLFFDPLWPDRWSHSPIRSKQCRVGCGVSRSTCVQRACVALFQCLLQDLRVFPCLLGTESLGAVAARCWPCAVSPLRLLVSAYLQSCSQRRCFVASASLAWFSAKCPHRAKLLARPLEAETTVSGSRGGRDQLFHWKFRTASTVGRIRTIRVSACSLEEEATCPCSTVVGALWLGGVLGVQCQALWARTPL